MEGLFLCKNSSFPVSAKTNNKTKYTIISMKKNGNKRKGNTLRKRTKRIIFGTAIGTLTAVSIITTVAIGRIKNKATEAVSMMQTVDKQEVKEMVNENIEKEETVKLRDHWTVAGFGLDSRDSDNLKNGNSDVIILFDMNGKTGDIKMVSVYRDTCLNIGNDKYRKANAAYANGGPKQAVQMLNDNLDIEIDDYVAVTWKSVAEAINILGGVDLEISKSEFKYLNAFITETVNSTGIGSYQLKEAGMQHLDGVQTVAYCRLRLMDDDFKRTERQRKVLKLILEKAKHADLTTLNNIITTVFPETSSSIDTDDLMAAVKNIMKLHISGTRGFPTDYTCKTVGGGDYIFPEDLADNVSDLHEFLYNTEDYKPSKRVNEISAAIKKKENGDSTGSKKETNNSTKKKQETKAIEIEQQETEKKNEKENEKETIAESIEETIKETEFGPGMSEESKRSETETDTVESMPRESTENISGNEV